MKPSHRPRSVTTFALLIACLIFVVFMRSTEIHHVRRNPSPPQGLPFPSQDAWLRRASEEELASVSRAKSAPALPKLDLASLEPNETIARLRARGVPFVDDWSRWPAPVIMQDWEQVASQAMSVNSKRHHISAIWNPHGFGSNFVSHSNFIIFAMFHNASMVLVKRKDRNRADFLEAPESVLETQRSAPQMLFEELFAYDKVGDTTVEGYRERCRHHANGTSPCEPPIWTFANNNENAEKWLNRFRFSDVSLFRTIKTHLYRALLTVTPKMRQEIDRRFREAVPMQNKRPWVAIHVRRGDKIRKKEADLTEAKDYVQACVRAGQAAVSDVYVMSDDPLGAAEIESNWTAFGGQPGTRFHRRFDPLRPDKTTVAVHQRNSFLHLLTDFRIMLESDFFIGTHTSNIGITVCTTRAWIQCYDAENPKGKYFWDGSTDKVRGRRRRRRLGSK